MSSSKHMAGPWIVDGLPTSSGLAIRSEKGALLAVVKHVPAPDMIASLCETHAYLMAAAPPLLAALQALHDAADAYVEHGKDRHLQALYEAKHGALDAIALATRAP